MDVKAVLGPGFLVWALFSLILLFQRRIEWHLRLAALLVCAFYGVVFVEEVRASLSLFSEFRSALEGFLRAAFQWTGVLLIVFWPAVILVSFYAAHGSLARGLLRIFIVLTLFYWLFSFASDRLGLHLEQVTKYVPEHVDWSFKDFRLDSLKVKMPGGAESGPAQNK